MSDKEIIKKITSTIKSCPKKVHIEFDGQRYNFYFYVNENGRIVALSNTVGCQNLFGEGHTWWSAIDNFMFRFLNNTKS